MLGRLRICGKVKVEKNPLDAALNQILKSKPLPREKIKSRGKRGPKTAILAKPSDCDSKESSRLAGSLWSAQIAVPVDSAD